MIEVKTVFAELNAIASDSDIWGQLLEQRSHIPLAYTKANDINYKARKCVVAMKSGAPEEIAKCREEMISEWKELGELSLPGDFRWARDGEAGQEFVEAIYTIYYYPLIFGGKRVIEMPLYPEILQKRMSELGAEANALWVITGISVQRWLAGLGDVPGELGKIVHERLLDDSLSMDERIGLLERYLGVAQDIYDFLDQGEDLPGQVIDNSRGRNFRQTFRGKLQQISWIIGSTQIEVAQMKNLASVFKANVLRKEA